MKLEPGAIIAIVVSATAVVVAGLITLYFLLLRNKRLTHQVKELKRRYDYTHQLLVGQDQNYIKRIESIAQVNLLYEDLDKNFAARYEEILTKFDVDTKAKLDHMLTLINGATFKNARSELPELKAMINRYEELVNQLNDDLTKEIQPEEEARALEAEAKDAFNKARQVFEEHQNELLIIKDSYEIVFTQVLKMFAEFDSYLDQADYNTATSSLPRINRVIEELNKINEVMPELCHQATKVIPQKIGDLKMNYKRILKEGCPVVHILSDKTISHLEDRLALVIKNLKGFKYRQQKEALELISNGLDKISDGFEKERNAKAEFDSRHETVKHDITFVEKDFIKLSNALPKIKRAYVIADEKTQQVLDIQNLINKLGVSKRAFDNLLQNGGRTPYSVLLERLNGLADECAVIKQALTDFRSFLNSLKEDVEDAHRLLSDYFYQVKKAEKVIRDSSMQLFHDKYDEKISAIYDALETISVTSETFPIDVDKVNDAANFIRFEGDSTLNQITQDQEMMKLAESALTYANRGRSRFAEINNLAKESEEMFNKGEFEQAYNNAKNRVIPRLNALSQEAK